jgi:hypothetical protein
VIGVDHDAYRHEVDPLPEVSALRWCAISRVTYAVSVRR